MAAMNDTVRRGAPEGLAVTHLVCFWCGTRRLPDLDPRCHACGGSLDASVDAPLPTPDRPRSVFDYAAVLPVGPTRITLGEGGTPLLPLDRLFPGDRVFVKAEWMNPTGSFKDRGSAVAVSAAVDLGAEGIVCASTGNNAASVSAYAARAGLPCIVTLPAGTPAGKLMQARAHGAIAVEVPGSFSDAYAAAERIQAASPRWANLTSTYLCPYMTAAHATIAYELAAELGTVGTVIVPIGAGPMLAGIQQGAERLRSQGLREDLPVLVGAQGADCAPIAAAFAAGADEVVAWERRPFGLPGSINDPLTGYPQDGTRTLRLIRASGGAAVAVTDDEIRQALVDLGQTEGIGSEPASATPLAALLKLPDLPRPVVLVVSGHALKDPAGQPGTDERLTIDPMADPGELIQLALSRVAARRRSSGQLDAERSGH